jgi:hypothetical protein
MKEFLQDKHNLLPEIDYPSLMAHMNHHLNPRRKIQEMNRKGLLTRLKKGFYILSEELILRNFSEEITANLLYGPSYISLEYALAYYDLIPEKVENITSVTTQRNKIYHTSKGHFYYYHLNLNLYPIGILNKKTVDNRNFLIASPEKSLHDIFSLRFPPPLNPNLKDLAVILEDDLRIDIGQVRKIIDKKNLVQLLPYYKNRKWNKLLNEFLLKI